MHVYLRLLKLELDYTEAEKAALVKIIARAPGVERVKLVEQHRKGGYAVTVNVASASIDDLVEYIAANGLDAVF